MSEVVLTGVKPTGAPHWGNYFGAIKPAIELARGASQSLLFIADYHSLVATHNGEELRNQIYEVAATWLACGIDPEKMIMYKQSDVPEILELAWILSCFTPKGFMNRAHAYKAVVQKNEEANKKDIDAGVNMGLYTYPVLMAADILLFSADKVPVGKDQLQHIEFARDIATKFNNTYGDVIKLPEGVLTKDVGLIAGLDGQKMSKSYNNGVPLFAPEKKLRKLIMKVKTDSSAPEEPKDPDDSLVMDFYKLFADPEQIMDLRERYKEGIGWGEAKQALFEAANEGLSEPRAKYNEWMENKERIDEVLARGAIKARAIAMPFMEEIRAHIGVRGLKK